MKKKMAAETNKPMEVSKLKQLQRESGFEKFEAMKAKSFEIEGGFLKRKPQQDLEEEVALE